MNRFLTLIKINLKLLLRNKGFLFFLCVTPMLSVFILNLNTSKTEKSKENENKVINLEKPSEQAVYVADTTKYIVKVFDAADSDLSEYMLEGLADTGMFSICRCKVENMTEQEILTQAKEDAYGDRVGVILYLKKDFDVGVMMGDWKRAVQVYCVSEDERYELFKNHMQETLSFIYGLSAGVQRDSKLLVKQLDEVSKGLPEKKVVTVSGKNEIALSSEFAKCRDRIGYSFAIVTLGFLFCGVCIAYTVIEEQENKVYTRIMLSKVGRYEYLLAKLVISFLSAVLQTGIIAICMLLFSDMDVGIKRGSYLFLVFLLGIIFNVLSLSVGVLVGDVMGANYVVFTIWSVSALFSGLYFPLSMNSSGTVIKKISYFMPQRWFMRGAEMLLTGDKTVYSMLLCITLAYVIVILSIGVAGLKMRKAY